MATQIDSLTRIELDFSAAGSEYMLGYTLAAQAIDEDRNGFLRLDAIFRNGIVPLVMRTSDLYVPSVRACGRCVALPSGTCGAARPQTLPI